MLHDAVFNHEAEEEAEEQSTTYQEEAEYPEYQEEEEYPEYQEEQESPNYQEEESGAKTVDIEVSETLDDRSLEHPMLMDALDFEHAEEARKHQQLYKEIDPDHLNSNNSSCNSSSNKITNNKINNSSNKSK